MLSQSFIEISEKTLTSLQTKTKGAKINLQLQGFGYSMASLGICLFLPLM